MKKLLFLLIFGCIALAISTPAHSQITKPFTNAKDSCVGVGNTSVTFGGVGSDIISFKFKAVKDTGTVAGTAKLQGSDDNTNWNDVGSAYTITDKAWNSYSFEPTVLAWGYYRIYIATTGGKIFHIVGYTTKRTGKK